MMGINSQTKADTGAPEAASADISTSQEYASRSLSVGREEFILSGG